MWSFNALCDEFYVNSRLYLKLELDPSRETLIQYFEQVRRALPKLSHFRRRDDGALVLEEADEGQSGMRRSVRLEPSALKFGVSNPPSATVVLAFGERVLRPAPAFLTLSELDFDYMEVVFGFDLEYRGNHDQLVADTLLAESPIVSALVGEGSQVIDCQPFLGVALGTDCETQVFVEIKGRTSAYELRTGEYEATPLSVYVTARRYRGGAGVFELLPTHRELFGIAERFAVERVVPHVVQPLASAIASGR